MLIRIKYKTVAMMIAILIVIVSSGLMFENYKTVIQVSTSPSIRLPIVMYHHVLKDSKRWGKYIISPQDFENDMIYLKNKGYTPIVVQDLIDFVYDKKPLPEKPFMITFDDGYLSNYEYIVPILAKHDLKAVISIVGEFTDRFTDNPDPNVAYAHLDWAKVKELVDSPYVEIQNHSYDMHCTDCRKGSAIMKGESSEHYTTALNEDIGKLQKLIEQKTGYTPTAYTYPYGSISKNSDQIMKDMGFKSTLSCYSGVNILTGNKEELYSLKRFNRPYGVNREEFFSQFEK